MSWLSQLSRELMGHGIPGPERRRILAELRDHIASEPGCEPRLGDPHALAAQFADELATGEARRCAFGAFFALATAAVALIVSQLAIPAAGGYPGFNHGLSLALFWPALIGMFIAPQVALVAGTLAAWRAVQRRRMPVLPAAEIALIRRRVWVGLGGGMATVIGLELYVVDFSSKLPAWWLALVASLAGVAGAALLTASMTLRRSAGVLARTEGPAGDVFDDLPFIRWGWLRRSPWRLGAAASLVVGLAMTVFEWHAEGSLAEGLQRGMFEGLAAAAGFAVLGRAIGARAPRREIGPSIGIPIASGHLAADQDRARAEAVLRDSFADGRLSLEELTGRLTAIHNARTIGELQAALRDLPHEA